LNVGRVQTEAREYHRLRGRGAVYAACVRALLVALGIAVVVWLVAVAALVLAGRKVEAKQLARLLPDLAALLRGLLHDQRVPRGTKVLVGFAIVWVVSPIDLLPEFLPVIGPLDDVLVVALVLRHLVKRSGPEVVREHWRGDPVMLERALTALRMAPTRT
jgi:uncharacterized membrane protein YkvA (DUF1232 family)